MVSLMQTSCVCGLQNYCFFLIYASFHLFFQKKSTHPTIPIPLYTPAYEKSTHAVNYGKKTAKRRQKDGKRTAKGR